MALKPITVTQLNHYISRVLTTDPLLGNLTVTGEISNLKYHSSGHLYFSISDENSKINCFFPAQYARGLHYELGDGLAVIIHGYLNVYKKGGTYTLFVRSIEIAGEGNLAMAFQMLKEKLDAEGLFDPAHKKPIPRFPRRIGIVTSNTGAAVRDIIKIIESRTSLTDMIVFPVLVQGSEAAADIAATIDMINRDFDDIDTLIVGRGGGSMEDLWAFNEEIVARAVYRSRIPVISAVGHEIDFTIADFVADRRAETPTAAAEMAVPDIRELMQRAESWQNSLMADLKKKVSYADLRAEKMFAEMRHVLQGRVNAYRHELESCRLLLDENHPYRVLRKGYAVLEDAAGRNLASISDLRDGQSYRLKLKDGSATFRVTELAVTKEERNDDI
mgnify:FL=1